MPVVANLVDFCFSSVWPAKCAAFPPAGRDIETAEVVLGIPGLDFEMQTARLSTLRAVEKF